MRRSKTIALAVPGVLAVALVVGVGVGIGVGVGSGGGGEPTTTVAPPLVVQIPTTSTTIDGLGGPQEVYEELMQEKRAEQYGTPYP